MIEEYKDQNQNLNYNLAQHKQDYWSINSILIYWLQSNYGSYADFRVLRQVVWYNLDPRIFNLPLGSRYFSSGPTAQQYKWCARIFIILVEEFLVWEWSKKSYGETFWLKTFFKRPAAQYLVQMMRKNLHDLSCGVFRNRTQGKWVFW